jgi:hypothetical protein
MEAMISHLDLTQIFCEVDDLCQGFERQWQQQAQLPETRGIRPSRTRMCLSEVMTIVIGFHGSRYRTFKDFYTLQVLPQGSRGSELSELHAVRGADAVEFDDIVLLPAHTPKRGDRHPVH